MLENLPPKTVSLALIQLMASPKENSSPNEAAIMKNDFSLYVYKL